MIDHCTNWLSLHFEINPECIKIFVVSAEMKLEDKLTFPILKIAHECLLSCFELIQEVFCVAIA